MITTQVNVSTYQQSPMISILMIGTKQDIKFQQMYLKKDDKVSNRLKIRIALTSRPVSVYASITFS